jgi:hypothetical protein
VAPVNEVETATGMSPSTWQTILSPEKATWLANHANQLRQLHATNMEICHADTVINYIIRFGQSCLHFWELIDRLRSEVGLRPMPLSHRSEYEDHVRFFLGRAESMMLKLKEMIERLRTQINVVSPSAAKSAPNPELTDDKGTRFSTLLPNEIIASVSRLPMTRTGLPFWRLGIAKR